MNNLNLLRENKFLDKLKEKGDLGYFDFELAEFFGWQLTPTRSTAGALRNRDQVNVTETKLGWYICLADIT